MDDEGVVHGSVEIAAPAEAVHAVLSDAPRMAGWSPEVLSMAATGASSGGCQDYEVKTKGLWSPLTYVVRRCRKGEGYSERLVASEDFTKVHSDWNVVPIEGGVRVDYVGSVEVGLPVPKSMLHKAQLNSMITTMTRLAKEATVP